MFAVCLGSLLVAACSPSEDAARPSATPTSDATPAVVEVNATGRHFGFIESVDPEPRTLLFDQAYSLSYDEANQAAINAGEIDPGETVPNDYFIQNLSSQLWKLSLADDLSITIVDWENCCEATRKGELEPFAASFKDEEQGTVYRGSSSPYWITLNRSGEVELIEEQYRP